MIDRTVEQKICPIAYRDDRLDCSTDFHGIDTILFRFGQNAFERLVVTLVAEDGQACVRRFKA